MSGRKCPTFQKYACMNVSEWKFKDFSTTPILREINLRDSSTSKTAIFANLETQNFNCYDFLCNF